MNLESAEESKRIKSVRRRPLSAMLRRMFTIRPRFSRDVSELMKDAHTFLDEANKNGSSDDESSTSSPCPWEQSRRSYQRKNRKEAAVDDEVGSYLIYIILLMVLYAGSIMMATL